MRTSALLSVLLLAACEEHGASSPKDGATSGGEETTMIPPDGPCIDDHEPNDTLATAFPAGLPPAGGILAATGLAICPSNDSDHFSVEVGPNMSLAAESTSNGAPLRLTILNAAGGPITTGAGVGATSKVCAPDIPAGTFF